jgi:protein-tyrosine phosphatase
VPGDGAVPGGGAVSSAEAFAARQVTLETCQNFRDLGGYETEGGGHVRWGRLFRADTLHRLSEPDRAVLAGLGLRTVIDLRATDEVARNGWAPLAGSSVTYHHLPMVDEMMGPAREGPRPEIPSEPGAAYIEMLGGARPAIARAVTVLARPGGVPAVFHCTAGKDRTGILAAVVLGALGVADELIVQDYVLTEHCRAAREVFLAEHDPAYLRFLESLPPVVRDTQPASMERFLAHVHAEHGSIPSMLAADGVGPAELASLRAELVER